MTTQSTSTVCTCEPEHFCDACLRDREASERPMGQKGAEIMNMPSANEIRKQQMIENTDHECPSCRARRPHREWSKGGYSWEDAMEVKTRFLVGVPPAIFGSMEPERNSRGK